MKRKLLLALSVIAIVAGLSARTVHAKDAFDKWRYNGSKSSFTEQAPLETSYVDLHDDNKYIGKVNGFGVYIYRENMIESNKGMLLTSFERANSIEEAIAKQSSPGVKVIVSGSSFYAPDLSITGTAYKTDSPYYVLTELPDEEYAKLAPEVISRSEAGYWDVTERCYDKYDTVAYIRINAKDYRQLSIGYLKGIKDSQSIYYNIYYNGSDEDYLKRTLKNMGVNMKKVCKDNEIVAIKNGNVVYIKVDREKDIVVSFYGYSSQPKKLLKRMKELEVYRCDNPYKK